MTHTVEEIGRKLDALDLWKRASRYNFAVRPRGTVIPYFCTVMLGDCNPVKVRFLLLEGWQTLHDYVCTRADCNYGFYSSPMEMPHFELAFLNDGQLVVRRHDPGYMPASLNAAQREFVAKILWEAYGVFLRMESDEKLPMRFSDDKAIFARIEGADGKWSDGPLVIPDPPPHQECVSLPKELVKKAKDLPFMREEVLGIDFGLLLSKQTCEKRPRCVYRLFGLDMKSKALVMDSQTSVHPEAGLRGMWESIPIQVLSELVRIGKLPGEVKVRSGRLFRMLRPLCMEFPFKLTLHDKLEM